MTSIYLPNSKQTLAKRRKKQEKKLIPEFTRSIIMMVVERTRKNAGADIFFTYGRKNGKDLKQSLCFNTIQWNEAFNQIPGCLHAELYPLP